METQPDSRPENIYQTAATWWYRAILRLYPPSFRRRFGTEMKGVFEEALDEHTRNGPLEVALFLGREVIETPLSILDQHLAAKSFWVRPYPINLLAFTLGFTLLGLIDVWNASQGLTGIRGCLVNLLSLVFAGGTGSLAIGSILNPNRKSLFILCGAVGFLLANTLMKQIYLGIFPDAFTAPGSGISFLVPFLFPLLIGSIFGLFVGIANRSWRSLIRFTGWGGLALLAGFFVNRLSAALMQSYLFPSSLHGLAPAGSGWSFAYLVIPSLLEGMLLGALFGKITQRDVTVAA
ncbi:MAG: hypothetical protein M1281_18220 [Chloroflexi bacterium]|nr:hypothetical protein [Chloroflexota bacterium]